MRDEIDGRMWVEHHQAFSQWAGEVLGKIATAFAVLHRIQWDAPWKRMHGRMPGQA